MSTTTYSRPLTTPADLALSQAHAARLLTRPADLPLSFTLDGRPIHGLPAAWQPVTHRRRVDATITETVFTAADPASGLRLRVEVTAYHDYPVLEWVAWLTNAGDAPTPLIADLRVLDAAFPGAAPVLHSSNGDFVSAEGYTPTSTPLPPGAAANFAPVGGRPCDQAFPYFRLAFAQGGLTLAVGWPAQWSAQFTGQAEGVHIQAGQERTHLRLLPGETIRTPRLTLLAWAGDEDHAVNLWRRWYLAHILPRPDGRPMRPHLACAATADGEEFTAATEANQIAYLDKFRAAGLQPDVWWIDAGWYACSDAQAERHWVLTGLWEPDAERFPRGLKPIADHAAAGGTSLLVWMEPERVVVGPNVTLPPGDRSVPLSQNFDRSLAAEHPDWLLLTEHDPAWTAQNGLLNLGLPACRQWLTDRVSALITANGIKIYRQDFNFEPLARWRDNEPADRQGLHENLHVQDYLQFWDDLLARHPGLWIDSCASGGRRNDLETMRRAVPLHYSDFGYGDHPVKLAYHHTVYQWLPYFKEFTLSWDLAGNARFDHQVDSYSFHCGFAPMLFATLDIRRADYDFALARQMLAIWRRAADLLLYGDYYPLTPHPHSPDHWVARQFDSPETGAGLVQAIRLPAAPAPTAPGPAASHTVHLRGLDPAATYQFEEAETGATRVVAAATLSQAGFTFTLPPRAGSLWFYRALESQPVSAYDLSIPRTPPGDAL